MFLAQIDPTFLDSLNQFIQGVGGPLAAVVVLAAFYLFFRGRQQISERDLITRYAVKTRDELDALYKETISELRQENDDADQDRKRLETKVDELETKLSDLITAGQQSRLLLVEKDGEITRLRKRIEKLEEQVAGLLKAHDFEHNLRLRYEKLLLDGDVIDTAQIEAMRKEASA